MWSPALAPPTRSANCKGIADSLDEFVAITTCSSSIITTCRTASLRSSAASSGCCRRAPANAPARPPCASRRTWSSEKLIDHADGNPSRHAGSARSACCIPRSIRRRQHECWRPACRPAQAQHRARLCSAPTKRKSWPRRRAGRAGAPGDQPRRFPRHGGRAGDCDRARRHDQSRGGRGARHGQDLRLRRQRPEHRLQPAAVQRQWHGGYQGRVDHGRRLNRSSVSRPGADHSARTAARISTN